MPDSYTIQLTRGDSHLLIVRWTDSELGDLEPDSARLQMRRSLTSSDTMLSLTDEDGLGLNGNEITISLTPEQTTDLLNGFYDLEVTHDDFVRTILSGRVIVQQDVTHD